MITMENIPEETLAKIENAASRTFTPTEIAWLIGMVPEKFKEHLMNEYSPIYTAYHKGKIHTKLMATEILYGQAKMGNTDSAETLLNNIRDMEADEQ